MEEKEDKIVELYHTYHRKLKKKKNTHMPEPHGRKRRACDFDFLETKIYPSRSASMEMKISVVSLHSHQTSVDRYREEGL